MGTNGGADWANRNGRRARAFATRDERGRHSSEIRERVSAWTSGRKRGRGLPRPAERPGRGGAGASTTLDSGRRPTFGNVTSSYRSTIPTRDGSSFPGPPYPPSSPVVATRPPRPRAGGGRPRGRAPVPGLRSRPATGAGCLARSAARREGLSERRSAHRGPRPRSFLGLGRAALPPRFSGRSGRRCSRWSRRGASTSPGALRYTRANSLPDRTATATSTRLASTRRASGSISRSRRGAPLSSGSCRVATCSSPISEPGSSSAWASGRMTSWPPTPSSRWRSSLPSARDGPLRLYTGYGPLISPLSGLSAATGYAEDGRPRDVNMAYGDPNGGVHAAVAVVASLLARDLHGAGGQVIDVAMWEAMICTAFEGWMNHALGGEPYPPAGNRDPISAPCNVYRCRGDDRWVAVSAGSAEEWEALCRAIGRPELAADPRFASAAARKENEDELDRIVAEWCANRDRWTVTEALQAEGVSRVPECFERRSEERPPPRGARGVQRIRASGSGREGASAGPLALGPAGKWNRTPCSVPRRAHRRSAPEGSGSRPDEIADLHVREVVESPGPEGDEVLASDAMASNGAPSGKARPETDAPAGQSRTGPVPVGHGIEDHEELPDEVESRRPEQDGPEHRSLRDLDRGPGKARGGDRDPSPERAEERSLNVQQSHAVVPRGLFISSDKDTGNARPGATDSDRMVEAGEKFDGPRVDFAGGKVLCAEGTATPLGRTAPCRFPASPMPTRPTRRRGRLGRSGCPRTRISSRG